MQISQFFCSGERLRFTSPLVTPPKNNECRPWKSMIGSDAFPIQIVPFSRGHLLVFRGVWFQIMGLTSRCFESCFCIHPGASMWLVFYLPTFNHTNLPDGDKYSRSHGLYGSYFLYSLKLTTNIAPERWHPKTKWVFQPEFSELLLMEEILHQKIVSLAHYFQGFIHPIIFHPQ